MSSQGLILTVYRDSHLFAQGIRTRYFDDIPVDHLTRSVVFIDPDIGLESGAAAYMRRQGPEKYLQYSELLNVSERSSPESVLVVYQHLQSDGRKRRNDISDRIAQIARRLGPRVWAVQWNDVAMVVATRSSDVAARVESSLAQYAARHRLAFYRASVHRTDPQGSCMPTVNSERIGNALQLLNQGLQIFVERSMKGHYGEGWREQADQGRRESPQKHKAPSQTDWDTQALLAIIVNHWRLVFAQVLTPFDRALIFELKETRNRWAHQKPFTWDDLYRTFDSVHRLLCSIGASQALQIERDKVELLQARSDEIVAPRPPTSPAVSPILRAVEAVPQRSRVTAAAVFDSGGTITNADELQAGDVANRRVLCPACRAKVFARWPSGWDAHAAHRCEAIQGGTEEQRKAEFQRRFARLFRRAPGSRFM